MKEWGKIDFVFQVVIFVVTILIGIEFFVNDNAFFAWILTYTVIGVSQLISVIIRLIKKEKRTDLFNFYLCTILPIWLILLIMSVCSLLDIDGYTFEFSLFEFIKNLAAMYLILGVFISPIMGIIYLFDLKAAINMNDQNVFKN